MHDGFGRGVRTRDVRREASLADHEDTVRTVIEEKQGAINGTLVKREGSPNNIAQAVLSFLDNDFVTGASLAVDGGSTAG